MELQLAKELIGQEMFPYKGVVADNHGGISLSDKSEFFEKTGKVRWMEYRLPDGGVKRPLE